MNGKIVKSLAGVYTVRLEDGQVRDYTGKGRLKLDGKIIVGDNVKINGDVIAAVMPRTNRLTRPPVANIDMLAIVLAPVPKPDFMLVDKLLIESDILKIRSIIIVNKSDLTDPEFEQDIVLQYGTATDKIIFVSALQDTAENGKQKLVSAFENKTVCLAGQSAVGKSSILNMLFGEEIMPTGALSQKVERGKHTTRHSELFVLEDKTFLADTPGFSLLAFESLSIDDCDFYYKEFFLLSDRCKYNRCTHTHEPGCNVKFELECGNLSKKRFERYLELRNELQKKHDNMF